MWLPALALPLLLVVLLVLVLSGGSGSADTVARRWVEVHDLRLADCGTLDLYTADYLEHHGFSKKSCADDPDSFFSYWFTESETSDSDYELVEVHVEGDSAVAEVEEVGGTVPHLRLFLVLEGGDWRIEAVGAEVS